MKKNNLSQLKCPKCGSEVVIYKGWATFTEEKIDIMDGAKGDVRTGESFYEHFKCYPNRSFFCEAKKFRRVDSDS